MYYKLHYLEALLLKNAVKIVTTDKLGNYKMKNLPKAASNDRIQLSTEQ